ncbi:MAG: SseB family protein [Clostridia bacterium]|nr:SseB family protein [Clostridia bacterium]
MQKAEKLSRMRGKKAKAQNKIKTVRFDLPQLISAYTASGKKKAHKKAILDALEQCPLIVPISAQNIEDTSLVYISKQAYALCGVKIIPYVMMADKQALLPEEENEAQRQGVMVKTVLSKTKTCIPVFADFKSAQQVFGTNEIFGIFTLKNIITHISHNDAVKGIIINPMSLNLKIDKEELMPPASE